ncbi:MAG: hypothetical protein KHW59_02040 [Clostridiales bacterium]|nr:hypothetical protein [Clostridiales bacterium]
MLLDTYVNFSYENTTMSLAVIIWGLYAGMVIGGILSVYSKRYLGGAVRALLAADCLSPDTAKTLSGLGVRKWGFGRALREGKVLRKCISIANEADCYLPSKPTKKWSASLRRFFTGSPEPKKKLDLDRALLYVPEDKKFHAEVRYAKKGSSPVFILIGAVLLLAVAIFATYFIPELLQMVDDMISSIKDL